MSTDIAEKIIESHSNENSTEDEDVPDYCQVVHFTDCKGQTRKVLFPKGLDLDRPKRSRTSFSQWQLDAMEQEFLRCHGYVVGKDRTNLSKSLGLTETQVKVWFQNRRTKFKKGADSKINPSKPKDVSNLLSKEGTRSSLTLSGSSIRSSVPTFQLSGVQVPTLLNTPTSGSSFIYKPPSIYVPMPTYKDYVPKITPNSFYKQFS